MSSAVAPALVEISGVGKTYDGTHWAVADLDLTVRRGEFLTLLGPSGSGKTTTLMMLAGFERISRGDIRLDGASLADKPPHRRNMGVVFQNYALFPHMSVARNLAFPLAVRGIRGLGKRDMIHNDYAPRMEVDAQSYAVRADGLLLSCEPAQSLPMTQRYFLF